MAQHMEMDFGFQTCVCMYMIKINSELLLSNKVGIYPIVLNTTVVVNRANIYI